MNNMIHIGNTSQVAKDYIIEIYDGKTLQLKAKVVMPDDMLLHAELMGEHYIRIPFNYTAKIDFKRTDYVLYNGIKYMMRRKDEPIELNTESYKYTLQFDAPEMLFFDSIMFYDDLIEWPLKGTAQQFISIVVRNVNEQLDLDYKVGIVEPSDNILISFDGDNVFDALTEIANQFKAEWYIDYENKTINLVTHHEHGELISLRREVALKDIQQSNENNEEYCTRVYSRGSTKNIPQDYRNAQTEEGIYTMPQRRLRLPVEVGDYIDVTPNLDILDVIPRVKIFDHIYPKRIGTITSLRERIVKDDEGNDMTIYYFKDSELSFKEDYILPGLELRLQFGENSFLNGRDFALKYHEKEGEFEIINDQDMNPMVPNEVLKPHVGDHFTLYNFDISLVGDQYVGEAEKELEEETRKWIEQITANNATYTCAVNPVYRHENNIDLAIGQSVRLESIIFDDGEKVSRVFGYDKYPATFKDIYIVGDKPKYSRFSKVDKTIEENKKIADLQYLEAMKQAGKSYKTAKALGYHLTAQGNETFIDGGLVLTTLIQMGLVQGDVWVNTSGMSGIWEGSEDIYLWGGGTLDQAINLVNDPSATDDVASFVVTHGGKVIMNQAILRGRFESGSKGNRIIIDPDLPAILFKDNKNRDIASITFVTILGGVFVPRITLTAYTPLGDIDRVTTIDNRGVEITSHLEEQTIVSRYNNDGMTLEKDGITQVSHYYKFGPNMEGLSYRYINKLPKSPSGLASGEWWNNKGVPNIVD